MNIEGTRSYTAYDLERFQEKINKLEPAPKGYEYKPVFGIPMLLPETGTDPLFEGTIYTKIQFFVQREVVGFLNRFPHSMHRVMLEDRDKDIRRFIKSRDILKDQIID